MHADTQGVLPCISYGSCIIEHRIPACTRSSWTEALRHRAELTQAGTNDVALHHAWEDSGPRRSSCKQAPKTVSFVEGGRTWARG